MLAASTPLHPRRKRKSEGSPGISPIRRRGTLRPTGLPKLPKGTTLELLRGSPLKKRPLAENQNMGNLPKSTVEAQTRNSLAYLNGIISLPAPALSRKRKASSSIPVKQDRNSVKAARYQHSQGLPDGLNSNNMMCVDLTTKINASQFPELGVISDCDEELDHIVEFKNRKTIADVYNRASKVPSMKDFVKPEPGISMRSSTARMKSLSFVPESRGYLETGATFVAPANDHYITGEHTTVIKSEPQDFVVPRNLRARRDYAPVKLEKCSCAPPNGSQRGAKHTDTYEFNSESHQQADPEISKFAMSDVESWKEMKDQQGVFFSKAPPPLTSGSDGDAFPARTGFLRMEAKKTLDIQSCANNVVFTVVKGKGRLKNKTEMKGANPKTDMIVGDILTVPQGSTFNFVNLGVKNDLILSYVKLS